MASNGACADPPVLDRTSVVPLWTQLAVDLRRRAAAGEFATRFPTDAELVRTYGVSRHTAREAVRVLRQEGLLERFRGRGSFMTAPRYEQPLGSVSSLFRWLESQGVDQHSKVLALDVRAAPDIATVLGLPDLAPLVHVARLRLANDEPLAQDEAWLPYPMAEGLLTADFTHTALYEEAGRPLRCHHRRDHRADRGRGAERRAAIHPRPPQGGGGAVRDPTRLVGRPARGAPPHHAAGRPRDPRGRRRRSPRLGPGGDPDPLTAYPRGYSVSTTPIRRRHDLRAVLPGVPVPRLLPRR
jgi:GntR family transcriptional regulator